MNSNTPLITDEERNLAMDAILRFSKLLEKQDLTLLPEIIVQNTAGVTSAIVVHGGRNLESGTAEDHLATGRELLERLRGQPDVVSHAALVYDAYLTSGDKKTSVIVVEMLGRRVKHTFAQPYALGKGSKVDLIGEPSYFAETNSKFHSS